jgi:hypothetical protein
MRSSAYYTILAPGTKSTPIRVFQTRLWNAANDACFVAAPLLGQKVPVFDHFVHSREVTGSRPTFMSCARLTLKSNRNATPRFHESLTPTALCGPISPVLLSRFPIPKEEPQR